MNRIRENIEFIGLDYRKEMMKIALLNLLIVISFIMIFLFLYRTPFVLLGGMFGLLVLDYVFLSSYGDRKKKLLKEHDDEFVSLLSYFEIFITNKYNVYKAFEAVLPYSSDWMKEKIGFLISQIDDDKSILPFMTFAGHFTNDTIRQVMMSIYQMVDEGESGAHLTQFTVLFDQLSNNRRIEMIDKKKAALDGLSVYPLIGAGGITVMLALGIISIMGDLMNVL